MGDMGDIFNAMRADRRQRVEARVEEHRPFIEQLKARAVGLSYLPGGFRFTFEANNAFGRQPVTFDYWPQRGKWCELASRRYRQGERALLRRLDELGVERPMTEAANAGLLHFLGAA